MPQSASGGTPSDLQGRILEGLLSGSHRARKPETENRDLSAKDLLPALQAVFASSFQDVKATLEGQKQVPLLEWWGGLPDGNVAIALESGEKDDYPALVIVPVTLVRGLLAATLGGVPGADQDERPATRLELGFAKRLSQALADAIRPVTRGPLRHFTAYTVSTIDAQETFREQTVHVIDLRLEQDTRSHALSIALPEEKVERRAEKAAAPERGKNHVAAEIGRTRTNVEVLVPLGDPTLDRLINLKAGDIFPLTPASLSAARLQVRRHDIFMGRIGRCGQNFGFQVATTARSKGAGLSKLVKSLTAEGNLP